ncbi:6488_t:CDS:2 [Dentiscutata erythropus]|uniref:6488_t:CDS:1 n=1 Tax=Dentiscutata erythropus TaxID=1348616 RepID=A0A9N9CBJ9_9GLOM|nr:6488_t:CDS:2 [Dentiscutata erythropus]
MKKNTNKKFFHSLIKDLDEFININFHAHQVFEYAFNGSIGSPVHEKLRTGAKVLEFGCGAGIWTTEVSTEYPNSKFYSIDFATQNSNNDNVTFISCDIHQMLPFPDNEFDYVFSRNKTDFFTKNRFQGFLFEVFRVLKPGGWLEIGHTLFVDDDDRGPAFKRMDAAHVLWHKERGIDFDLITHLEDYLQMTGKAEFISSQTVKIPLGGDGLGEFYGESATYYVNLMKEFLAPYMGVSFEEYDRLASEIENELRDRRGEVYSKQKRVFARKKDIDILKKS